MSDKDMNKGGARPDGPGSGSLRSPEPVPVSAHAGDDPSRGDIALQLRIDADEMEACGAGNEAANMRRAADLIEELCAEIVQDAAALGRAADLLGKAQRELERVGI